MDSLGEANKVELENVQTSVSAQNIAAWYGFHKRRVNPSLAISPPPSPDNRR